VTYKSAVGSAGPQVFTAAATAVCDAGQHVIGGAASSFTSFALCAMITTTG
jgi:hypothetical protein